MASVGGNTPPTMSLNYYIPNPAYEGSPLDIFYNYSNFNGQTIYWSLTYSNASDSNISGNTSGSFSLYGSGGNVIVINPKADFHTEGTWYVNVNFGSQPGWNDYFNTGFITVYDSSFNFGGTFSPNISPVNEGQTCTYTITDTSNQTAGQTLYWSVTSRTGSYMSQDRFPGNGKGTFTMNTDNPPVGTFDVTVSADHQTSPGEQKYKVGVWVGDPDSGSAVLLIESVDQTVIDTSQTVNLFSLTAPPSDGRYLPWTDSGTGITADITNLAGNWGTTSNYGGGIVWDNANHGYVTLNYTDNDSANFTLSFAADFQPEGGHWNTIFGSYFGGPFAYAYGNTISAGVGSNTTVQVTSGVTGLAWWDFVYMGTTLTIYKNGTQVATGTIPSTVLGSNIQIGSRPGTNGDYLVGTIYQIRYQRTALLQIAITSQYDAVKSTYGLS